MNATFADTSHVIMAAPTTTANNYQNLYDEPSMNIYTDYMEVYRQYNLPVGMDPLNNYSNPFNIVGVYNHYASPSGQFPTIVV